MLSLFDFVRNGFNSVFHSNTSPKQTHIDIPIHSNCSQMNQNSYYRKLCTRTTMDLWSMIDKINDEYVFHNQTDFTEKLVEMMSFQFNLEVLDCHAIVDNVIDNRLIIADYDQTNQRFRFVANRDINAFINATRDWYCFECHSWPQNLITMELIGCETCLRSFHSQCVERQPSLNSDCNTDSTLFQCHYCRKQSQQTSVDASIGDTNRLNKLLEYILRNVDYFMEDEMYHTLSFDQLSNIFVLNRLDLKQIESKALSNAYQCLNEFENDIKQFEHNFFVSPKFLDQSVAKRMEKFSKLMKHELSELKICVDCYQYSNELQYNESDQRTSNDWFIEVCSPPHQLVYARVKNYSYWPSKLLRVTDKGLCDVRFFDPPNFTRALVSKDRIKPITHRFTSEYIWKWKLEQPIRLMVSHMNKLDSNGLVIEQTITNNKSVKYKDFVKMISPILNSLKRKNELNNDNDEKVTKKMNKNKTGNKRK